MPDNSVRTLKQFYDLMSKTRALRLGMVKTVMCNKTVAPDEISKLKEALAIIEDIPSNGDTVRLLLAGSNAIETMIVYEVSELKKDIYYLENGESKFLEYLENIHPGFSKEVEEGVKKLKGLKFNNFITDRDGTINNYCGRYRSSIQSVYNSVFLTRFANQCAEKSVIITSAPLENPGIVDVSVNPEKTFIYAASKAREYIDAEGVRHTYPVKKEEQKLLDDFNHELTNIVSKPEYEKYSLIGSGLQLKFGQTTIARQDINASIPEAESLEFSEMIKGLIKKHDPTGTHFILEDTGYDLEIILTIDKGSNDNAPKDFNKANGIDFLDSKLNMDVGRGPNLISGDTSSDVCMIEHSVSKTKDTWTVFVTKDIELANRVKSITPNNHIVSEPDMLITILNKLSERR